MATDFKHFIVLVVDDEAALRDAIVFEFKRKGFTVLSAENGLKAFEVAKLHKVNVVVSDMRMPGGDGLCLLDQLRKRDPKDPPLIFVTGFADVSESECIARGATKVISKPFERRTLVQSVYDVLGIPQAA